MQGWMIFPIAIGMVFVIIVVAICVHIGSKDYGECLERKMVNTTQVVMVGKTPIVQPVVRNQCVLWEFPEGRPE